MFCCCCFNDTAALEDDAESSLKQRAEARQTNGEKTNRKENIDVIERTTHANRILNDKHTWCMPETHVSSLDMLNNLIRFQDEKCVVDVERVLKAELNLRLVNKERKQNSYWIEEMKEYERSVKRILSNTLLKLRNHWFDQYRKIVKNNDYKDLVNELERSKRNSSRRVSNPPTSVRTPSRERRGSVPVVSSRNLVLN
jgi:hypothetical protein